MSRALLIFLAMLVWCAPAQAAPRTVARSGEFTLQARESGGRICLTLRRDRHYQGQQCGRVPRSPQRALSVFPDVMSNTYSAAVPPSVMTAEIEARDGRRTRRPTFTADGFHARFVLLTAPPSAVFVRFYGADGALLGIDGGPVGYIELGANATQVFGEHFEGVEANTEARLLPTPDQPDRLATLACVDVTNVTGGSGVCDDESENAVVVMGSCRKPSLVGGIVAAGVTGIRLTLGSGAEFTAPATDLPAVFGGRRAVGANVPDGEAVRDAAAVDAAGQVVARVPVGTEPGAQPCVGSNGGGDRFSGPLVPVSAPQGVVAVGSDGLLVADQGERLCVALGQLPAANCPLAPADSDDPHLLLTGNTVAAALSRDAARITLEFDRGNAITVPTTDGAPYAGRWAGKVRFFSARIPAGRKVTGAIVRNTAGTIIGVSPRGVPLVHVHRAVLARRGPIGLERIRRTGEQPCVSAFATELPPASSFCTDPNPGTPIDRATLPYSAAITVPCAPRQAIAYGRLPDRMSAPQVVLEGGGTVRSRTIALNGEDAWVAFLPDAAVRGLRAGKHRVALSLPPASAQCGYSAYRAF